MAQPKIFAAMAIILMLAATSAAFAEDQHHPAGAPGAAAPSAAPGTEQGMPAGAMSGSPGAMPMTGMMGPGGMPMMGMMRDGKPGMPMGMMCMGEGGMCSMPMGGMPMMAGHTEGRIAFLKTELKVTEAQLPLWNAVADAIRASAKSGMGMMDSMGKGGKLLDRLAARETMMTAQLEALRTFKKVADPFYASLSEDQKKTADELLMSPMGMM